MAGFIEYNRDFIQRELENDGLYSSLLLDPAYHERLLDEHILSLDPNILYSTTVLSEEIFKIPNSTLRGYIIQLSGYVEALEATARKKALPYISVFKLHMVLLTLKKGESLATIKVRLGLKEAKTTKKEVPKEEEGKYKQKYNDETLDLIFKQVFGQLQKYQTRMNAQERWLESQNEIGHLRSKLAENENARDSKLKEIENIKSQITINRLYRKLDLQTMAIVQKNSEEKGSGFFSLFSKKSTVDFEKDIRVDEKDLKTDYIESKLEENIKQYTIEVEHLNEDIEALSNEINEKENKLRSEIKQLEQFTPLELDDIVPEPVGLVEEE
ncbi:hypothetical protein [Peribacillus asahii]|uniref:hypothetical protein n=1 Tax=Peribacillus asahii TaxID=228899 RepID=UPI00207A3EB6|nr:hypothetical protein [Peribacillus asahii]USK62318.1 hypothetical protein LIT37_24400 [Peribacillus asahii]